MPCVSISSWCPPHSSIRTSSSDSSDDDSDERYNYDSDDLDGLSDFDTDELTDYDEMEDGDDDGDDDEHSALTLAERQLLDESVDEEELRGMNELEREELLANRAEKRQQLLERLEIQKRLRAGASGARRR